MPFEILPKVSGYVSPSKFRKGETYMKNLAAVRKAAMFQGLCFKRVKHICNLLKYKSSSMFQMFPLKGEFPAELSPPEHCPPGARRAEAKVKKQPAGGKAQ